MLRGSIFSPGAEEAGKDAILGRSLGTQAGGMSREILPHRPHAAEVPRDWPCSAVPHDIIMGATVTGAGGGRRREVLSFEGLGR